MGGNIISINVTAKIQTQLNDFIRLYILYSKLNSKYSHLDGVFCPFWSSAEPVPIHFHCMKSKNFQNFLVVCYFA